MEKNKLLFILVVLLACSSVFAKALQGDIDAAKKLTKEAENMALDEIYKKWSELQEMLGQNKEIDKISIDDLGISLKIFVSKSMSPNLLKEYVKSAQKYNATLIFKGLPDGTWQGLSELIVDITNNQPDSVSMQIDDESFNEFAINKVPSIILSQEEDMFHDEVGVKYDKICGSVSVRRALEIFAEKGDLSSIAKQILSSK